METPRHTPSASSSAAPSFVPPLAPSVPNASSASNAAPLFSSHRMARVPTASATALAPSRVAAAPRAAPSLRPLPQPAVFGGGFGRGPAGGGAGTPSLVFFRADLRVHDNEALTAALREAGGVASVVPVFVFDPRHFGTTTRGFMRTGPYRTQFLIDAVRALRDRLRALGGDLVVRVGKPEDVVPELARRVGARTVFAHAEDQNSAEQQVFDAVRKRLKDAEKGGNPAAELRLVAHDTLYHTDDLPFDVTSIPNVYSDFREALQGKVRIRDPLPAPEAVPPCPPAVDPGELPSLKDLGVDNAALLPRDGRSAHRGGMAVLRGGEKTGLARLHAYTSDNRRLASERSAALASSSSSSSVYSSYSSSTSTAPLASSARSPYSGASTKHSSAAAARVHLGADFSCAISPWLALGCVSARRVFADMRKEIDQELLLESVTYFELMWRDFFRFIRVKFSRGRAAAGAKEAPRQATNAAKAGSVPALSRAMAPSLSPAM